MTKILIVRFSSIGDIVLTSPVVRCLKKQWDGDVEVHFLTKKNFHAVVAHNPYIHKIHTIEKGLDEVIGDLQSTGFDYVIDLHNNIRSAQVKRKLKAKAFTFRKLNVQKWLLVNLKTNRMPDVHIVDRYMDTVSALGIKNDGEGLDHFIGDDDALDLSVLPESHQKPFVAWVIGGAHATKAMPAEKIISIAKRITVPIVLLGGKSEVEMGDAIADAVGTNVYNACGKFGINQSAALVKLAGKVITNDTGLMHIASAYRKDILSVWGNTVPELGMYPYLPEGKGSSLILQVDGLKCRPCSKIGYDKCPKGHFRCMMDQDEDKIIEWANT